MAECAIAADTKVETPEGALTIKSLAGKFVSVFTRDPSGRVRFRLMQNIEKVAEGHPVLRISLENGEAFRVGTTQVLYKKGMVECRADALAVGDELQPAFHFPEGYHYQVDTGGEADSRASWRVTQIEPAGSADLYGATVAHTGCFFVAAGVLCKARAA